MILQLFHVKQKKMHVTTFEQNVKSESDLLFLSTFKIRVSDSFGLLLPFWECLIMIFKNVSESRGFYFKHCKWICSKDNSHKSNKLLATRDFITVLHLHKFKIQPLK